MFEVRVTNSYFVNETNMCSKILLFCNMSTNFHCTSNTVPNTVGTIESKIRISIAHFQNHNEQKMKKP